jgi:adenylylsulfate kinase-like enzyme
VGNDGPFFRNTNLSEKRFSRPFTLAQICINSFGKAKPDGEFVRARLQDIEDFFEENHQLERNDENLIRIMKVLKLMDKAFGKDAAFISSRAIAVSGYLFIEELVKEERTNRLRQFSQFYSKLLGEIKHNTGLLSRYEKPSNPSLMEEFQKYILQASVEAYSIKRRHEYLRKAFNYYLDPKTKGKIIGGK